MNEEVFLSSIFQFQAYDDAKLAECIASGDERGQRKFQAVSDGPKAAAHLDNLKQRVKSTEDQVCNGAVAAVLCWLFP